MCATTQRCTLDCIGCCHSSRNRLYKWLCEENGLYQTKNTNISAVSAKNKATFPPCGGKTILDCMPKRKKDVLHSNIYFWLDDMTLCKDKQSQYINSSLDILKVDWDETKCIQEDSNNCGLWDLLTIFRRKKGCEYSVGKLSPEDL